MKSRHHSHTIVALGRTRILPSLILCASIFAGGTVANAAPEITFSGNSLRAVDVVPERTTGLDKIYVLYDTSGVSLSIPVSTPSRAKIYKFSNLGGAYAEEINSAVISGGNLTLDRIEGNIGYIVEDGDSRYYFWIVNYSPYRFEISGISAASDQQCEYTVLDINAKADPIHYFTINGQQKVLDREIKMVYDTQEWSESSMRYETIEMTKMYESLGSQIMLSPPSYCSTSFHISGDKFLTAWHWTAEAESEVIRPHAVMVHTTAEQEGQEDSADSTRARTRVDDTTPGDVDGDIDNPGEETEEPDESNQIRGEEGGLGGSAPATIYFNAYATEGVIHHEWQMAKDPEFEEVDYRFNEQNLEYTFNEEGTFYLRYIGSNDDGSCEAIGDTYTVNIGGSELLCPNAFTPDGDGVNDKWKVAYRSLLEFKCWIFDRHGHQLFYFDNPDEGWDGLRGDKPVRPGVYYYVIQAVGADGKKYKKSGDINIIRHRDSRSEETVTE